MKVLLFKITRDHEWLWKKGQRVFGEWATDEMACAVGRFRGKGRWIRACVRYQFRDTSPNARFVGEVEVGGSLEKALRLQGFED